MHTQKGRTDAARGSSPFGAGSFASLSIYISHLGAAALSHRTAQIIGCGDPLTRVGRWLVRVGLAALVCALHAIYVRCVFLCPGARASAVSALSSRNDSWRARVHSPGSAVILFLPRHHPSHTGALPRPPDRLGPPSRPRTQQIAWQARTCPGPHRCASSCISSRPATTASSSSLPGG